MPPTMKAAAKTATKAKPKVTRKAPTIKLPTNAAVTAAVKRGRAGAKKAVGFTNVFGMKWQRGLGKFDKDVIVFKKAHISSPKWAVDPFGTKYCCGFTNRRAVVVAMLVPKDALVVVSTRHSTPSKCRCDKAYVLGFLGVRDKKLLTLQEKEVVASGHNGAFLYKKGELAVPQYTFDYGDEQCSSGIHFFMTAGEAASW